MYPIDPQHKYPFALYPHTPYNSPYYHMRNIRTNQGTVYKANGFVIWLTWFLLLAIVGVGLGVAYNSMADSGVVAHLNKDIFSSFQASNTTDAESTEHADLVTYILAGAAVGALLGLIIGTIHVICAAVAERKAIKHFEPIRLALDEVRVVACESRARVFDHFSIPMLGELNPEKWGRVYLTYDAIEFYDNSYEKSFKNFLINIHDVCYVKPRGLLFRRVCVYTMSGKYVFRVPTGAAIAWCCEIRHVMQRGGRSILRPTSRA